MFPKFLFLALLFTLCASRDTITINQTITDGEILISQGSIFALGFFSPGNSSSRYLGIWFYNVPEQSVVWVANRNNPINDTSGVISINQYGDLVLYDGHDKNIPLWSTNVSVEVTDSREAHLLDTGNLVLVQNDRKQVLWQSFEHPTDTLLPGMFLGMNKKTGQQRVLTSWKSPDDPGTGKYMFRLNPEGSPQFFLYQDSTAYWHSSKQKTPYWRCGPHPWMVRPLDDYNYSFINNEDEIYYAYRIPDTSVITRFMVDQSGSLLRLTWQSSDRQWKEFWSAPRYRCENYGHCGAYGVCNLNSFDEFECSCLPGYEPKSQSDWKLRDPSGGCVRKHTGLSMCGNGEGFMKVTPVKPPDTTFAAQVGLNMTTMECQQACLRNCSCIAYTSIDLSPKGIACLAWHGELMDTEKVDGAYDIYVRVDAIELAQNARNSKGFLSKKRTLAIIVPSVSLSSLIIVIVTFLWCQKKSLKKSKTKVYSKQFSDPSVAPKQVESSPPDLPFFDLSTIFFATNNFSPANKLGEGGFGSVYKGQLPDGQEIAVKRLSRSSKQGLEEYKNEVMLIAKLQHRNLVKLLGSCFQEEEQMLIYEYLPNKSLDIFIFDKKRRSFLDWRKRFHIIVGIARGILYLHQDSRLRIIHRDLKTSNILLDVEMNPKISDFGMARIFKGDQIQHNTTRVVGTYGYMSPEYVAFGKFSVKSDVYSFGVILLEIISGKKNNGSYEKDSSLIGQVWELWKEERALDILDSSLESYHLNEVLRCIQIGLLCVQDDAVDRPNMSTVLLMLNGETALPSPKQPAFIFRKHCKDSTSLNEVTITNVEAR